MGQRVATRLASDVPVVTFASTPGFAAGGAFATLDAGAMAAAEGGGDPSAIATVHRYDREAERECREALRSEPHQSH